MAWVKMERGGLVIAGVLALAMGCVHADFESEYVDETEPGSAVAMEVINVQVEQIAWDWGMEGEGWRNKLPDQEPGVCECTGHACMEDWVDSNLGCDLCVAVECPGVGTEHVCVSC
jgi:hypothetical protein